MKTATEITLARAREEWEAPLRAEIDALRHDIERHIAIATEQANHITKLEARLRWIADHHDLRSELYTSDADCAAGMAVIAKSTDCEQGERSTPQEN
jgi:hypothetical protein